MNKQRVFELVKQIPYGKVSSYKELAIALGNPNLARVVGNILNKNPNPNKIPCFKVIKSDGKLGGYKFGIKKKIKLLRNEGIEIKNDRIDLKKYLYKF